MTATRSARRRKRRSRFQKLLKASADAAPLSFQAQVSFEKDSLEAAPDGVAAIPKFSLTAYNGGKMRPRGFSHPVIVNLSGVKNPGKIPVFMDHETSGKGIVGHANVSIDGSITADGIVSGDTDAANTVVKSAKRGFPWQVSIGANVVKKELVRSGEKAEINGNIHEGPFLHIVKSDLHEISFVPIGADSSTSAQIAARRKVMEEQDVMDEVQETVDDVKADAETKEFDQWLELQGFDKEKLEAKQLTLLEGAYKLEKEELDNADAAKIVAQARKEVANEIRRQKDVRELTKFNLELQAKALEEGWSVTKTELEVMRREFKTRAPLSVSASKTGTLDGKVMECAMCMQNGMDANWLDNKHDHWNGRERGYDEKTIDAASSLGEITFGRLFHDFLHANNISVQPGLSMVELIPKVRDAYRTLRASGGFSTIDISGILSNVMGKSMLAAFSSQNDAAQRVSSSRSVRDFKETKAFRLTGNGDFLPVGPTGELQLMQLQEQEFPNRPITYGRMISVSRTMLINDDMNALTGVTQVLGRKAALKLQKEFFTLWLDLSTAFFVAGNSNYIEGAATNLQISSLTSAKTLFLKQTDQDGDPIDVSADILLVPSDLEVTAQEIMQGTTTMVWQGGGDTNAPTKVPTVNPHVGQFSIVSTPWISDGLLSGSTLAWYLLANPSILAAAEIVYLNGRTTPFIESEDTDFSVLGFQWRSYFDFGIAPQDHRAGVMSKGEA